MTESLAPNDVSQEYLDFASTFEDVIEPDVLRHFWNTYQAEGGNDTGDYPFGLFLAELFADASFVETAFNGGKLKECRSNAAECYNLVCKGFNITPANPAYALIDVEATND